MYEEFSKVIHGMAKNNVYCPRCSNLVALEWSSVESGTHMIGVQDIIKGVTKP